MPSPRDPEFSSNDSDSDDQFSGDEYRRDSRSRWRSPAENAGSYSRHSPGESLEETSDTELRPRRPRDHSSRQRDSCSEPDNDGEPRSSRRRAAPERHASERLTPQGDEYRRQAMEASSRDYPRQPHRLIDVDDEELQRVFKANLAEKKARDKRVRQREEKIAAREAAEEAAAIAESARLAANPTAAQRQEADADAELERVLSASAAEAEEKEARAKADLASLHARFGITSGQQLGSGPSRDSASSASSQRERANSEPQTPAGSSTGQRERSDPTPREPVPSSTERLMSAGNNLLRRGVELARRSSVRATPAVRQKQPQRASQARLAEMALDGSESPSSPAAATRPRAHPDPPRAVPKPPGVAPNPAGEHDSSPRRQAHVPAPQPNSSRRQPNAPAPQRSGSRRQPHAPAPQPSGSKQTPHAPAPQPSSSRRQPHAPAPQPNQLSRRNSERAPHVERQPIGRAPPTSSRRYPEPVRTRELDPSIRQALNNSERWARLEQGRGGRNFREEEHIRMAIQNSLGDAPLPPDPIEGLIDPPPPYHKIGRDKKLDPLRYTTTNDKGNEPGFKRHITPEILAIMKKFLLQQHKFDVKAKAAGNDLPPANNAMSKKQKRAPVADNSLATGSSSSAADPVDSLENLLGTRLPPPRLARGTPTNRAAASSNDEGFVSCVPGLASDARRRIPQSRPWDNAFSRLPRDRRNPSGRS